MRRSMRCLVSSLSIFSLILVALPGRCVSDTRFGSEIVTLTLTVNDQNGRVTNKLTHKDFMVFDNNEPQKIAFYTSEDKPRNVGIVFDRSRSARHGYSQWFSSVCRSILRFKEESNQLNQYFIIGADSTPKLITDWTRESGALIDGLSRLAFIRPEEGSALFDSCRIALEKFKEREGAASVMLLISDGNDGASKSDYRDLLNSFTRTDVMLYSICASNAKGALAAQGRNNLRRLAEASGGAACFPSSAKGAAAALSRVAAELPYQRFIGYYPTDNNHNGSWHSIRVATVPIAGDQQNETFFIVRTRPGYYARSVE